MDAFMFTVAFYALLITGRGGENIALNKPTLMRGENGESGRAVDGGYNPDYYQGSCALMSDSWDGPTPYLWWIVDLQAVYDITHVVITKRTDYDNADLYFEMYNYSPILCASEALLCQHHPLELKAQHNLTCAPGTIGRFFMVKRNELTPTLNLCEVEIYGTFVSEILGDQEECQTASKLDKETDHKVGGDVVEGKATSRIACSIECMTAGMCAAYSFNPGLAQCVYAVGDFVFVYVEADVTGWDTYRFC